MKLGLASQIALKLGVAFAVSVISGLLVVPLLDIGRTRELAESWMTFGLGWAQESLSQADAQRRLELLERMRPTFGFPVWIEDPATLRQRHGRPPEEPTVEGPPGATVVVLPLGDGAALLAGPMKTPPPTGRHLLLPVYVALTVGIGSSFFIAYPLTRRLRRLELATRALARGELSARVMEEGHDAIGELAQSFNGMAGRIQELFEQREQLLQAVSHEIGTPLARVRFHLEALEDARDDAARMKRVAAVDKELREIDRLAIELTSWVEANGKAPDRVSVDLSGMLRETAEHEGRGTVQLVVEIPPEPLRAVVDPVQIQRAIDNVVRNALRYAKSRVVLSARKVEGGCRIEIRDDGPGIPAADRRRVLEPFARLEPSRSRAHGGMGLGLAITHRIVVAHGGSLTIETAPEGGAAIVMMLSSAG